jgi:hypothetical protein
MPAGAGNVTVTNAVGTGTLTSGFTALVAAPTISGISHSVGDPSGGGAPIVITGTGFGTVTAVTFLGTSASFTIDSPTQITATLPAHSAGSGNVTVTNPGGSANISFTYLGLDLSIWLRANGSTGYETTAGVFTDISGNGRHTSPQGGSANAPPYGTTVNTHRPPLHNHSARYNLFPTSSAYIKSDRSRYFYAALVRINSFTTNQVGAVIYNNAAVFGNFVGGSHWMSLLVKGTGSSGEFVGYTWDGALKSISSPSVSTGNYYLVVVWLNASGLNMVVNGTSVTPVACGAVAGLGDANWVHGRNNSNGATPDIDLVELMLTGGASVASESYGSTEAAQILTYCRQRYNLALT